MFVPHNHANITYHKQLYPLDQAVAKKCHDDYQRHPECHDHWWTQPRAGESWSDSNNTEHATKGPTRSTKLEFLFTGSTAVNISGECNSTNLGLLLNSNGSVFQRVWNADRTFATASKLVASKTYNLTVAYEGNGILAIAGFHMDENAKVYNISDIGMLDTAGFAPNSSRSSSWMTTSSTIAALGASASPSAAGSTGQTPSNSLSTASPITRGALAGIIVGSVVFLVAALAMAWFIRKRILARRAPSYAFRHGVAEAHWTQRPLSPAVPRSADWETYAIPTTDEVLRSPLLERTPSVSETHSKVGIAM